MSALAWRRRPGHAVSRPESSASAARHLRRRLAAALLALPLFAAVTAPTMAIAQTPPTATLSFVGGNPLPEGAGGVFNVALSRALGSGEKAELQLVTGGTATRGTDYRIVCVEPDPAGSATCNRTNGKISSITFDGAHLNGRRLSGPLRLETIEDADWVDETVTLRLGGGPIKTMTITDAPSSVEVTFTRAKYTVAENAGLFQPVFRLDKAAGRDLVIPLTYVDMTATSGADYTRFASATITADGDLTPNFDIPVIDDGDHEGDETFRVGIDRFRLPAGVTVGSIPYATVTITDNDPDPGPPGIVFENAHLSWNESQGCGEFEYYDTDGNKITGNTPQQRRQNALAANAPKQSNQFSTRGASMELPASAPGPTYRVKLKTKPNFPVKVTVHDPNDLTWWGNNTHRTLNRVLVGRDRRASNGRNRAGKPTLTFTPSNWDQWQTVKVKVACTDHFPDAVPLEHRMESRSITGSSVKYAYPGHQNIDNQRWKVWVRVHEETPPVEIVASGLPPAGQTITLAEGATRDFKIRIGERMLPNGSSGRVSVSLFTEVPGNVLRATRRDGEPLVQGTLHDTMVFESSSREQWVRLQAVGVGNARLVVSAERDFTWAHETRRHWSPTWPVTVEHPGICGRTKEVRDAIVGRISGVNRCHDVTPQHLAAISGTLGLGYIPPERTLNLQAGDFDGLTSLTHLDLEFAELSTLPTGIFDGLTSLTRLDLDGNPITALPAGIFDGLTSLTHLTLTSSRIGTLPAGIFDGLTALTRLDLSSNQITALPAGIFDGLTALTDLRLHFNRLSTLPAGIFDGLTTLTNLSLANNRFTTLPDGIFAKLTALNDLFLLRNSGAPFAPTVPDAGDDRVVATGAQVTLSGTAGAGGPWGDNVTFEWEQVDGPNSDTPVATGVTLNGATSAAPTFTAPATPGQLYFRLAATPRGFSNNQGMGRAYDWVTITVGAGQNSPQQDEQAGFETAEAQAPSCVSDALLADARLAASETWRTSPGHVERWSRVLAAFGESNGYSPMTVAEAQAQADRGLKRWKPVAPALECLAAAPEEQPEQAEEEQAPPVTPELSLRAGSAVDEGGNATFTVTADPAPATDLTIAWTVAQSGDYLAAPGAGSRTVVLTAGATSTDLSVATTDDAADEADGSVSVTLGTGTGYTIATGKGSAAVAVRDNDEPVVSIAAGNGVTEGSSASFTVSASPAPAAPLDVTLTVAQSGDFAASGETGSRTVTVPVTGSATFEVATVDDGADEPDGSVTATLGTGTGYTLAAAPDNAATVAVSDNDAASSGPTLSIADASFKEGQGTVYFTVTLSEPAERTITVRYATRDSTPVSARAGQDYFDLKRAWRLPTWIFPGKTTARIPVYIYNDSHDEDPETFEVVIFDADDGVSIADGVAVGTITNDDPMPAAWLARFGRTAAEQALDGIAGRIAAPRSAGVQGTIAGQALNLDPGSGSGTGPGSGSGAANDNAAPGSLAGNDLLAQSEVTRAFGAGHGGFGNSGPDGFGPLGFGQDRFGGGAQSRSMTGREALLGSSFTATGEKDGTGGSLAFWGRAAQSSFDGREGTFSLDGEATSAMLGADYARGNWLVGMALMQSSGEGGYADRESGPQHCPDVGEGMDADTMAHLCGGAVREGDGKVEASLTAALPYAAIQASERLKLWGAAGYGTGEVTLKPEVGGSLSSDISWTMAAAGVRNDLVSLSREGSGLALALTSDALWARTSSEKTHELAASDSDVTRLRLGLEGSWRIATGGGGSLTPKLEIGARHDGGDAETGFGVELGGGLAWVDPALGLSLDLSGRTLVAHGSDDLEDRGFAASLAFDPDPATARGPSLTLTQDWGGAAQGGLDALFASDPLADRTGGGEATARWSAEAAWGFPAFSGRFTGSPHVGLGLATGARDYSLGWRLAPAANANAPDIAFGVKGMRRESDTAAPEHTAGFEAVVRW